MQVLYSKSPTISGNYQYQNINFKQNIKASFNVIQKQNLDLLSDIASAYKEIQSILDKKTMAGINSLVNEHKGFNTLDGLTFKNINELKDSVSFELKKLKSSINFMKILVKDKDGNIKNGYLIKDGLYLVKNYDLESPNKIPQDIELYNSSEINDNNFNETLSEILNKIDESMFSLRKFVLSRKDTYLKLEDGRVSGNIKSLLTSVINKDKNLTESLREIPPASLNRYKAEYEDYCFKTGQVANMFKNIGDNKEKVLFSNVYNSYYGNLSKILVFNSDDTLKTGYLLKDDKIVANYNPEYPNVIPDKLKFVDIEEMKSEHFSAELENYLNLYNDKLNKYSVFMIQKKRNVLGQLNEQNLNEIQKIDSLYQKITELLSKYSLTTINKIKGEFSDFDLSVPKRGYTFKNIADGTKINILKMKSSNDDKIYKIILLNNDNEEKAEIVVKNLNQPINNYKLTKEELDAKVELLNKLNDLSIKMEEFEKFITNRALQVNKPKEAKPKLEKTVKVAKAPKLSKEDSKILLDQFKDVLKNLNGDIANFDTKISEMRAQILEMLNKSKD